MHDRTTFYAAVTVENAAFEGDGLRSEITRVLSQAAEAVAFDDLNDGDPDGDSHMKLRDSNGNTVGEAGFTRGPLLRYLATLRAPEEEPMMGYGSDAEVYRASLTAAFLLMDDLCQVLGDEGRGAEAEEVAKMGARLEEICDSPEPTSPSGLRVMTIDADRLADMRQDAIDFLSEKLECSDYTEEEREAIRARIAEYEAL